MRDSIYVGDVVCILEGELTGYSGIVTEVLGYFNGYIVDIEGEELWYRRDEICV